MNDSKVIRISGIGRAERPVPSPDVLVDAVLRRNRHLTTMRKLEVLWPSTRDACHRLAAWIADLLPAPDDEAPTLLHKCLSNACQSGRLMLKLSPHVTDQQVAITFYMGLIEHTAEIVQWDVRTHTGRRWEALGNEPLHVFHARHKALQVEPRQLADRQRRLNPGIIRTVIASRILDQDEFEMMADSLYIDIEASCGR
jgi:hypothetical protein